MHISIHMLSMSAPSLPNLRAFKPPQPLQLSHDGGQCGAAGQRRAVPHARRRAQAGPDAEHTGRKRAAAAGAARRRGAGAAWASCRHKWGWEMCHYQGCLHREGRGRGEAGAAVRPRHLHTSAGCTPLSSSLPCPCSRTCPRLCPAAVPVRPGARAGPDVFTLNQNVFLISNFTNYESPTLTINSTAGSIYKKYQCYYNWS